MKIDHLFTSPGLCSPTSPNYNLLGTRRAARKGSAGRSVTYQLIQPAVNCGYLAGFSEGDEVYTKKIDLPQLTGNKFSLDPIVNDVVRFCYYAAPSKELRVGSISEEDGHTEDSARCAVDGDVRCIEWVSASMIVAVTEDSIMELSADPLVVLQRIRAEIPRHPQTCCIELAKDLEKVLIYGVGGFSIFTHGASSMSCSRRFLCSGRITSAINFRGGVIVCRIEAHEDQVQSSSASEKSSTQSLSLDRLLMPDGSALPSLLPDNSRELAITLPTTVFLCVFELADQSDHNSASLPLVERTRKRIDHRYKWLEGAYGSRGPLFAMGGFGLAQVQIYQYKNGGISVLHTIDLQAHAPHWEANCRMRGLSVLGDRQILMLVSTFEDSSGAEETNKAFVWANKIKAPVQWDAVTVTLDSGKLGSSEDALQVEPTNSVSPDANRADVTTSQLFAEVASLRWEMDQMRDTVNKIGADVAAIRRLMEMQNQPVARQV